MHDWPNLKDIQCEVWICCSKYKCKQSNLPTAPCKLSHYFIVFNINKSSLTNWYKLTTTPTTLAVIQHVTSPCWVMSLLLYQAAKVNIFRKHICFSSWVADQSLVVKMLCNTHCFFCIDSQFSRCWFLQLLQRNHWMSHKNSMKTTPWVRHHTLAHNFAKC